MSIDGLHAVTLIFEFFNTYHHLLSMSSMPIRFSQCQVQQRCRAQGLLPYAFVLSIACGRGETSRSRQLVQLAFYFKMIKSLFHSCNDMFVVMFSCLAFLASDSQDMQLATRPAITYNSTAVSSLPSISFAPHTLFTLHLSALLQNYLVFLQSLLFRIQAPSQAISASL